MRHDCVVPCLRAFLVIALIPLAAPLFGQGAYTLDQVLAKMDGVGKTFRSMQGDIERTKVTVLVDDHYTDSGNIYFTRRGDDARIKLEITRPETQQLLIDNGKAQLYFPKIKQVQEHLLGKDSDKAEFILIGFGQSREDLKKAYDAALAGEETIDGQATSILDLKPKDPKTRAMFTSIRLWLDQKRWIPVQVRTTEASGDYMIMKFRNIRMNARIPDSVFDLKMPKDVQTIRL